MLVSCVEVTDDRFCSHHNMGGLHNRQFLFPVDHNGLHNRS